MSITAAQVKELREMTSAGMMDCKKALTETQGDMDAAIQWLREHGLAKAGKKSDRITAEGCVVIASSGDGKKSAMVEINSETDFVARHEDFMGFANAVADIALKHQAQDVESLLKLPFDSTGKTVDEVRAELIAKIGENIQVRRVVLKNSEGVVGGYVHNGRIGVLVDMKPANMELARDIAMHIAAFSPQAVRPEDVSAELVEKEKEIFRAQAAESGKPAEIIEKMIGGRINKFLNEVSLYGQLFAKDQEKTVAQILKAHGVDVDSFLRFEVGEGIEKKVENFADEVRAQLKGN